MLVFPEDSVTYSQNRVFMKKHNVSSSLEKMSSWKGDLVDMKIQTKNDLGCRAIRCDTSHFIDD